MNSDSNIQLTTDQIEQYLLNNPEFFNDHLNLLESLTIPHPSGEAISLISKQLEIFRSKHHELENQLTALIEIARDNDTSSNRMHQLTLALLDAATIEEAIANLEHVFAEHFMTDFAAVRIIAKQANASISNLYIDPEDADLQHFSQILHSNQAKCGRPSSAQAKMLFGEIAHEVKSCAIIPMAFTKLEGLIVIGSREENRFHYSMGNLFLTQMSEIIGTRLISLLNKD